MKNFGGAVIITTSTSQRTGGTEEDSKGQATGEPGAQSSFAIDDKSVTECLISGDEAWYSLNKAQLIATTLTAKNSMWADSNKTILHNGKVNVIMIALDQDQLRADHDYLFSKLYWMNETDGQYAIDQTNRLPMDTATLRQMGVVAGQGRGIPAVVQDCKGNTAIKDVYLVI